MRHRIGIPLAVAMIAELCFALRVGVPPVCAWHAAPGEQLANLPAAGGSLTMPAGHAHKKTAAGVPVLPAERGPGQSGDDFNPSVFSLEKANARLAHALLGDPVDPPIITIVRPTLQPLPPTET